MVGVARRGPVGGGDVPSRGSDGAGERKISN